MKKITSIFLIVCLCLGLAGCSSDVEEQGGNPDVATGSGVKAISEEEAFEEARHILKKMTLKEKIGQMFIVDIDKLTESDKPVTEISDEIINKIETYKLGGVVLGGRNIAGIEQIKGLNQALSECSRIPMYIGTEEEGGGENSIAVNNDEITATGYISPAEMGKNMTEGQLEDTGGLIAEELSNLGFNLNFAPTADVAESEKMADPDAVSASAVLVIGEPPQYEEPTKKLSKAKKKKLLNDYQKQVQQYNQKLSDFMDLYMENSYLSSCFSVDEDKTSEAVGAMVKGMRSGGVATVLKTFPGISSVARYHKLVEMGIDTGLSRLRRVNFEPFDAGIDAGTDFIMVGHVYLNKVDKNEPASFSRTILSDLLRKEMGFEGIIMTEQMDVPVVTNKYTTKQAMLRTVISGADMIYDPEDIDEAVSALEQAVMFQEIDEKVINQAVLRILQNKILRGIYAIDNK